MTTPTKSTTHTLTDLLSHLVRFPSVTSAHATNRALIDWIASQLDHLPLKFQHHERDGIVSLTATTMGATSAKQPKLWLAAHTDVVPGEPSDFEPEVRDGRLYGRGVYDMKYGIAVFMKLLLELGDTLDNYDLGLMLTSDEEVGGHNGCGYLAERGYGSQAMLLPECGIPWNLEKGAKGLSWWRIESRGVASHGAYPWLGKNPIDSLMDYLTHLRRFFPAEPCHDPKHLHHTMTVGSIDGGGVYNRVPEYAEAKLDLRTLPEVSIEEITSWFDEASRAIPDVTATLTEHAPGFVNPSDGATQLFTRIVRQVTGRELANQLAHASSDARFFGPRGTQVICVPPTGGGQHSSSEWIDLAGLDNYYTIVRTFVTQWAKLPQR